MWTFVSRHFTYTIAHLERVSSYRVSFPIIKRKIRCLLSFWIDETNEKDFSCITLTTVSTCSSYFQISLWDIIVTSNVYPPGGADRILSSSFGFVQNGFQTAREHYQLVSTFSSAEFKCFIKNAPQKWAKNIRLYNIAENLCFISCVFQCQSHPKHFEYCGSQSIS